MANADIPIGFELIYPKDAPCFDYLIANADALAKGDTVYLDSSGYASDTASGVVLGVAMDNMRRGTTGAVIDGATTSSTTYYDYISVCVHSEAIYKAQISTGALTSPYTTRSSAACYEEAGTYGVQYINAAASTNDTWKVIGAAAEYGNGSKSAVGTYQKVYCKINPLKHAFGCIA
jgi:hypothetical protein